ncbi:hypothetical protein, partial [Mesorhizobium sp. M2E.F.Ca.ET.166.01.1.1]|uniref:hypothetical protein n=1 Tax=Mesorhizobium sp. M2E.F.Ca.ET.166.01.1.1 TaxID=2500523 RepID=UPI001AEF195B
IKPAGLVDAEVSVELQSLQDAAAQRGPVPDVQFDPVSGAQPVVDRRLAPRRKSQQQDEA